ncbi:MAG: hypothetical protein ACRDN9_08210 [Streptosporangiaceae bacterium]
MRLGKALATGVVDERVERKAEEPTPRAETGEQREQVGHDTAAARRPSVKAGRDVPSSAGR